MAASTLFYVLIFIILFNFIFDSIIEKLNTNHFNDKLPVEVEDVYEKNEYIKSQSYKKENFRFNTITSLFSIVLTLSFFFFDGFKFVDELAREISNNSIVISLLFFGIIMLGSDILTTPFAYYKTFVIEQKFGFNKTSKKLFWADKLKGWFITMFIGGIILSLISWFYQQTGKNFWLYAWLLMALFSVFMNMFYSTLIVPLFNKQTPLEDGNLKQAIEKFAEKVNFKLDNIFVIDGSKRSSKANAYFAGFGKTKRIVLYDTLINELTTNEIVAVLAHEIGHYKHKHVFFNLISSILLTGLTLFIFSLFIDSPLLSKALGVEKPNFHIGLIAFSILYTPISEVTSLIMNFFSRKFEYQADNFAKKHVGAAPLISSLKKLSKNSLSNLTPHKFYVFLHYSHPTLTERIVNLKS